MKNTHAMALKVLLMAMVKVRTMRLCVFVNVRGAYVPVRACVLYTVCAMREQFTLTLLEHKQFFFW